MSALPLKILLLGGTGEARELAMHLLPNHEVIYSIAGIVRKTPLPCRVISGGFSKQRSQDFRNGAIGLFWHLKQERYDLVIDATHPYAVQISTNAALACQQAGILLWRYQRKPWVKTVQDDWQEFDTLDDIIAALARYKNPFFTAGRSVFDKMDQRLAHQHWVIRTAGIYSVNKPGTTELKELGPYHLSQERELFLQHGIDVLVTKNSGGDAVVAKLLAARELALPVYLLKRPILPTVNHCFTSMKALLSALSNHPFPRFSYA